jgi:DnaK suppressor protein
VKSGAKRAITRSAATRPTVVRAAPVRPPRRGYTDERFLNHQRNVLEKERTTYLEQANSLQEEAELLVAEMEPGDIQFDEESGEGGTVAVDRERDLTLSAQALEAVEEINAALTKIDSGKYGVCEGCGELIPKLRLEALPYARLCMACKSGGLSRR